MSPDLTVSLVICGNGCGNGSGPTIRLTLDVGLASSYLRKPTTVVIEVVKLNRNVFRHLVSRHDAGGEAVADACFRGAVARIEGTVPVDTTSIGGRRKHALEFVRITRRLPISAIVTIPQFG